MENNSFLLLFSILNIHMNILILLMEGIDSVNNNYHIISTDN